MSAEISNPNRGAVTSSNGRLSSAQGQAIALLALCHLGTGGEACFRQVLSAGFNVQANLLGRLWRNDRSGEHTGFIFRIGRIISLITSHHITSPGPVAPPPRWTKDRHHAINYHISYINGGHFIYHIAWHGMVPTPYFYLSSVSRYQSFVGT